MSEGQIQLERALAAARERNKWTANCNGSERCTAAHHLACCRCRK